MPTGWTNIHKQENFASSFQIGEEIKFSKILNKPQMCHLMGFLDGSVIKNPPANAGDPWVGKIPWRRKWQPTPVFLPRKYHGQRSLVGYSPWGRKRVRHELKTKQWEGPLMWVSCSIISSRIRKSSEKSHCMCLCPESFDPAGKLVINGCSWYRSSLSNCSAALQDLG